MVEEIERVYRGRVAEQGREQAPGIDPVMQGAVQFRQPEIPGEGLQNRDHRFEGAEQRKKYRQQHQQRHAEEEGRWIHAPPCQLAPKRGRQWHSRMAAQGGQREDSQTGSGCRHHGGHGIGQV